MLWPPTILLFILNVSADQLPIAFNLEADRMRNLLLNPADFNKEIQVVMEERWMRFDDNPVALTSWTLYSNSIC